MRHIRGSVVVIASLTLVGGCSLGSSSEGEDPGSSTSSSSAAEPQETHTETVTSTETASSGTVDAGGSATAAHPSSSSTTDVSPDPGDDDPEQAVEDFAAAVADADHQAICDAFDPELVRSMEQGGQDCAEAMEDNWEEMDIPADASVDVRDSEISADGTSATVTVRNQDGRDEEIDLEKVDGDWKITLDE